jgi:agmatinase
MTTAANTKIKSLLPVLGPDKNFLGIDDPELYQYHSARYVIQQVPYEHTSSYMRGSAEGPQAILEASHYVEFYDEYLVSEPYLKGGICTLAPIDFAGKIDSDAIELIEKHTEKLIADDKFVISLGAEHTVTLGFVKAHAKRFDNLTILQLDAHSDLRESYQGNPYSHASVMARIHHLGLNICQVGIRAQCKEEYELIKSSDNIHSFYAHHIRKNPEWVSEVISCLTENVYITIDADGFDPSVIPSVGTPEPGGLYWEETIDFLQMVFMQKNVIGFDVVEIAPKADDKRSPYNLAKLVYRLIGFSTLKY